MVIIYLHELSPLEFEELIKNIMEQYYQCACTLTPLTKDGGKDIIIHHPLGDIYVECKSWYFKKVGINELRSFESVLRKDGVSRSIYVSTEGFSPDATLFANQNNIILWDFNQLSSIGMEFGYDLISISDKNRPYKGEHFISKMIKVEYYNLSLSPEELMVYIGRNNENISTVGLNKSVCFKIMDEDQLITIQSCNHIARVEISDYSGNVSIKCIIDNEHNLHVSTDKESYCNIFMEK